MQEQFFISLALNAWKQQVKRADQLFTGLTDEQLYQEIAPGKNRPIYLLGHLTAIHDALFKLFALGERSCQHLDQAFITSPDKAVSNIPTAGQLRELWANVHRDLNEKLDKLQPQEWFEKHTQVSDEDFKKEPHRNKLNVLLNRTNHLAYHIGQLAFIKK